MVEQGQKTKRTMLNVSSKFWKALLVVFAVLLIFVGPTYMIYVFESVLNINYFISVGSGFALFIFGLMLLLYLIKKGVIT
jgi:hypothetical protein